MTNNKTEGVRIGEDNICPLTKEPCLDECCPPGAICNLSGNLGQDACKLESLPSPPAGVEQRAKGGITDVKELPAVMLLDSAINSAVHGTPSIYTKPKQLQEVFWEAISQIQQYLSIAGSESQGREAVDWKDKYEKCIQVIKRFDPGIIGMYDL